MKVPPGFDFLVYADGSCIGNPGPGGWGVIVVRPDGSESEHHGANPATTNNQMEITAAVEGCAKPPRPVGSCFAAKANMSSRP